MTMGPTFSQRNGFQTPPKPEVSPDAGPVEVAGLLASLPPALRTFGEAYHAMVASCRCTGDDSTADPERAAEMGHAALEVLGQHPTSALEFTQHPDPGVAGGLLGRELEVRVQLQSVGYGGSDLDVYLTDLSHPSMGAGLCHFRGVGVGVPNAMRLKF